MADARDVEAEAVLEEILTVDEAVLREAPKVKDQQKIELNDVFKKEKSLMKSEIET